MTQQLRELTPSFTDKPVHGVRTNEPGVSTLGPLSDVLRAVRLNGAHFYYVEAGHPNPGFFLARPSRE